MEIKFPDFLATLNRDLEISWPDTKFPELSPTLKKSDFPWIFRDYGNPAFIRNAVWFTGTYIEHLTQFWLIAKHVWNQLQYYMYCVSLFFSLKYGTCIWIPSAMSSCDTTH